MPTYPVFNKRTGKKYEMPWDGDNPPDTMQVRAWIDEQERPKSLLEKASTPLTDIASRTAEKIGEPMMQWGETPTAPDAFPGTAGLKRMAMYGGAFTKEMGKGVDELFNPINLGLMAVTGGASAAARAGSKAALPLALASRGAGVAQMAHGGYKAYKAKDPEEFLGGVIEGGLGFLGARQTFPSKAAPQVSPGEGLQRMGISRDPTAGPSIRETYGITDMGKPPTRGPQYGTEGLGFREGEIIPDRLGLPPGPEPPPPPGPPGLPPRGGSSFQRPETLPGRPPGYKYFQGRKGTSEMLQDVETPDPGLPTSFGPRSKIAALKNFGKVPSEAPPEGYFGTGQPDYSQLPDLQAPIEAPPATPPPAPPRVPKKPKPKPPVPTPEPSGENRPFAKSSDADVESLVSIGDESAIAEARLRPSLAQRLRQALPDLFGDERGAILPERPQRPKGMLMEGEQAPERDTSMNRRGFFQALKTGATDINDFISDELMGDEGLVAKQILEIRNDPKPTPQMQALEAKLSLWMAQNGIDLDTALNEAKVPIGQAAQSAYQKFMGARKPPQLPDFAASAEAPKPPIPDMPSEAPPGHTRLYRGTSPSGSLEAGRSGKAVEAGRYFTSVKDTAEAYTHPNIDDYYKTPMEARAAHPEGKIEYVDVPTDELNSYIEKWQPGTKRRLLSRNAATPSRMEVRTNTGDLVHDEFVLPDEHLNRVKTLPDMPQEPANLPPEFTPVGGEEAFNAPRKAEIPSFPSTSVADRLLKRFGGLKKALPDITDETGAIGNIDELKKQRAAAAKKGVPPPDSFDAGLYDEAPPPEPKIDVVKQLFDSLKQQGKKLASDETGSVKFTTPDFSKYMPDFLKDKEPPEQFQDWVGQRQVNRMKFKNDPGARKVANDIARERFRGWLASKGYIDDSARGIRWLDTAPEELVTAYKNYLQKPNETIKWAADKASLSKNFALSAGLPYTGVNAHGFNILARSIMGNPSEALTTAKYLLNPKDAWLRLRGMENLTSAAQDFSKMPGVEWAIKKGLTLTTEGHEMGITGSTNLAGKALQGFLKTQGKMFEDPLFQQVLPAVKMKHFNSVVEDMMAEGLSREQAGRQAAKFVNNLYGGINWEQMGANKDLQNVARIAVLAPDWLASNLKLGKGAAASLLSGSTPAGSQYRKMVAGLIGSYAAANAINYAFNGEPMWENDPGHAMDIHIGQSGGKERYIRPFGTAADFARLPIDFASALLQGDLSQGFRIMKNRASIPASSAINMIWNENRFGRPLGGKDVYGRKIPTGQQLGNYASEISNVFLPPYAQSVKDYALEKNVGGEEAALGSIEAPFRYSNTPKDPRRQRARRRTR